MARIEGKIKLVFGETAMAGSCSPLIDYEKGEDNGAFVEYPASVVPGVHCSPCTFKARCSESTVPMSAMSNG